MQHEPSTPEQLTPHPFVRRVMIIAIGIGVVLLLADVLLSLLTHTTAGLLTRLVLKDLASLGILAVCAYFISRKYDTATRTLRGEGEHLRARYLQLRDGDNQAILLFPFPGGVPEAFSEANTAATRRLGFSADELRSRTIQDLVVDEQHERLQAQLEELAAQRSTHWETVLAAKGHRQLPVEISACLVEHSDVPTAMLFIRDISDAQHVEESLREARASFRAINTASPMGIISLDVEGNVKEWNKAAEQLFGWREFEVFGHPLPIIPSDRSDEFQELSARVRQKETLNDLPFRCRDKSGAALDTGMSLAPLIDQDDQIVGMIVMLINLSLQQEKDANLQQVHRDLDVLSEAKRAVFRAVDEGEILRNMCETIVRVGGYELAWVGFTEGDALKTVQPVTWFGENADHVQRIQVFTADSVRGKDPIALAVRSGNASVFPHLLSTSGKAPWLDAALNNGFDAVAVLPLLAGWQTFGVLVVYARQADTFTDREVELLAELADDLAYGIEAMRMREERQRADQALLAAARQWRSTFDAIAGPISVVDTAGNVTRCNRATTKLVGKSFDKILGHSLCEMLHGTGEHPEKCLLKSVAIHCQAAMGTMRFNDRWYALVIDPIVDESGKFQGAIHIMTDITEQKLADEEAKRNYKRLQNIINETISTIAKIAEMRDPYTSGHEQRVSHLSCAIAREMGLSVERTEGLRVAGMMHDIGKLYVPAEILSKSGKLTDAEFAVIKQHPQAGFEILKSIDFPWPVAEMAQQHHERMDGSGYPHGLSGEKILLEARILAVADVVESMASHRPYRPARGLDAALKEITQGSGSKFDADVVDACVRLIREKGYTLQQ